MAESDWSAGTPPLTTPWTSQVSPSNALPEYPRPQLTRPEWHNLNGLWEFAAAAEGEQPPFGRTLPERVLVPYPIESALSGLMRHEDRMWYRRTFTVPSKWKGQRLVLNFGAVDYDAEVWVNGEQVATHRGGYDGFSVDVTDALRNPGSAEQELIVWAEDRTDATWQPIGKQRNTSDHGIFYQGSSGIWQTVWMEPVAPAHVTGLRMTPDLTAGVLRLRVDGTGPAGLVAEATAYEGDTVVGTVMGALGTELSLPVPDAKPWSPDSPFLYDLTVQLLDEGNEIDRVRSYFGMRSIGMLEGADGKLHLALNGEILFHLATLDQGFWPDGLNTAPTDEALAFDLVKHKELGFNAVRKHIKVEPDRWYHHADRLGLLVWQDMPSSKTGRIPPQWREQFESELRVLVDGHSSWTSIVGWVPFNEGWGEWDRAETGRIADAVKTQDPSRLVDAHSGVNCCDSLGDSGRGDVIDSHQYVGPAAPIPWGERVSIDGEHGGFGLAVDGHLWFGEGHAYELAPDSETLTRRYVENQRDVLTSARRCGISGSIYTQITDVEGEINGFYTYDRRVAKMDVARVRAVNEAIIAGADGSGGDGADGVDGWVLPPGTPGLQGIVFYPLDESSGRTAGDAAGDHDGTLVGGASFVAGRTGNGVAFDGTGEIDTGAALLDTGLNYSVSAWVRLDRVDDAFQTVVSQDGPDDSAFFLQYSGADERFAMSFPGIRALAPDKPEPGRWYHLVGVRDAAQSELRLFVDGKPAGTERAPGPDVVATGHTVIGRGKYAGHPVDFVAGTVDQVHVYDRALAEVEIRELHATAR